MILVVIGNGEVILHQDDVEKVFVKFNDESQTEQRFTSEHTKSLVLSQSEIMFIVAE